MRLGEERSFSTHVSGVGEHWVWRLVDVEGRTFVDGSARSRSDALSSLERAQACLSSAEPDAHDDRSARTF